MHNRGHGFLALLAVIAVSIVFGMILGGKLNAPKVVFAAPDASSHLDLPPASTGDAGMVSFADVVEQALPAVVAVTSTSLEPANPHGQRANPFFNDPFFRRFFSDPEEEEEPDGEPEPRPRIGEGSGFIISTDGYILTNNHVVDKSNEVEITLQDGSQYDARVVGADPSIDLALLKIEPDGETLPTLPLGDSENLRIGEWVIAIGNPLEFDLTVTVGVVSGKGRRVPVGSTDFAVVSFIQTDAAINFGNSGGPLIDARGNVVGINTAINRQYLAEGIGFALPINQARAVVEQLRERGYVRRGFIGITMNRNGLDDTAREFYELPDTHGVIVSAVQDDGPGERAGLRAGDVIRKVDGEAVRNNFELVGKIASHQPGDSVELEVFRKSTPTARGKTVSLSVTLADRDEGMEQLGGVGRPRGREPEPEPEIQEATGFGLTVEGLSTAARQRLGLSADQEGVVVTDVDYGSPASDRGIRPNMVIIGINDRPIEEIDDWRETLDGLRPGESVKIDVLDGEQTTYFFLRVPAEN